MRDDWDTFFMKIAYEVATRATCDRKHVGCLLVRDNLIVATGYNGSIPGTGHCDDIGHIVINGACLLTVHAEQNSVCQAAKRGVSVKDSTAYITCEPCWGCYKLLLSCGITRIVYSELYKSEDQILKDRKVSIAQEIGIKYEKFVK